MSRWFRFYDEVVNDPKVQRLPADKFKTWVNLLCLASGNGGVLPALSDISFALRISEQRIDAILKEFYRMQLLDKVEPSGFAPHNWNGRQFKSDVSYERVKRFRKRQRNVTPSSGNGGSAVTETAPDSDSDTDTDSVSKKKLPTGVGASGSRPGPDPPPEHGTVEDIAGEIHRLDKPADAQLFARGKEVLGKGSGGLISDLKKHFGGNVALARASIEQASTKHDPREYIGAIIRGKREDQADKSHLAGGLWDRGL